MVNRILFIVTALPLDTRQGAAYSRIFEYAKALVLNDSTYVYLLSSLYPDNLGEIKKELIPNIFICGNKTKKDKNGSLLNRHIKKQISNTNRIQFVSNLSNFLDEFVGILSGLVYPSLMGYRFEKEIINLFKSKSIHVFSERNELKRGIALNKAFPKHPLKKIIFLLQYPFIVWDFSRRDKLANEYDGNIAISTAMEKYLQKKYISVIRVPILSDIEKFQIKKKARNHDLIQIGYTGSLTFRKDGLGELIKSIWVLKNKYNCKEIILNIYGSGYWGTIIKLENLVKKLGLSKNIYFKGRVTSEEIPEIQVQQDILVLTRPLNLQTRFGFSTKLAEYMASGVVVLTTDVSDNLMYIKDGENGFIAKSYLAEKVAEKLFDIIINERYLDKNIIKSAQKTASKHFNSRNYRKVLFDFLFSQTNFRGIIES